MKLKSVLAATLSLALSATAASAYVGDWYYDDNPGRGEYVELGDASDGTYLVLRGYSGACGPRGDSYATMRQAIGSNYPYQVEWWIENDCGSTARICVVAASNWVACSTYRVKGWKDY